jgi:hypothetical protein
MSINIWYDLNLFTESGTIFGQVSTQILNNFNAKTLRQPSQAWKVKLIGEGADDAGGKTYIIQSNII